MKNLFRLLFCTFLMTCGSDEDSGNDNVINLPASISTNVSSFCLLYTSPSPRD